MNGINIQQFKLSIYKQLIKKWLESPYNWVLKEAHFDVTNLTTEEINQLYFYTKVTAKLLRKETYVKEEITKSGKKYLVVQLI